MWCLTPSPRKPPLPWPGLARSLSCRHWRCLLLSVPGPPRTPGKQLVLVGIGLWRRVGESSQSLRTVATRQGGVQYRHYFVWRLAWVIPDFAVCFKDLTSRPFRLMDDMFAFFFCFCSFGEKLITEEGQQIKLFWNEDVL